MGAARGCADAEGSLLGWALGGKPDWEGRAGKDSLRLKLVVD